MTWTDEFTAQVVKMWERGLSCTVIGQQFGLTRNAVIGRMHRLGYRRGAPTVPNREVAQWTPDMDAKLRTMSKRGDTRAKMAETLGLTYGQVLSRCRALKLAVTDARTFTLAEFTGVSGRGTDNSRRMKELGIQGAPARIINEPPDPSITGLTCVEMPARGACRWPLTGTGAEMIHCGQRSGERTYCGKHTALAYAPPIMSANRAQRNLERSVRRYS